MEGAELEEHPTTRRNSWKLKQQRYCINITNLVRKSKQSEAVKMFDQMLRSKVKPDVVVYNTILAGYGKQGDANMAFKTFNQVTIESNTYSGTSYKL